MLPWFAEVCPVLKERPVLVITARQVGVILGSFLINAERWGYVSNLAEQTICRTMPTRTPDNSCFSPNIKKQWKPGSVSAFAPFCQRCTKWRHVPADSVTKGPWNNANSEVIFCQLWRVPASQCFQPLVIIIRSFCPSAVQSGMRSKGSRSEFSFP